MKKSDRDFLFTMLVIFLSATAIYSLIGFAQWNNMNGILHIAKEACEAAYFICGIFCGIYLFIKFISKKRMIMKLFCALVFPLTSVIVIAIGVVMVIPYSVISTARALKK